MRSAGKNLLLAIPGKRIASLFLALQVSKEESWQQLFDISPPFPVSIEPGGLIEPNNHADVAGKPIGTKLATLRPGISHVETVGPGVRNRDRSGNRIPTVYQNFGSVPTAHTVGGIVSIAHVLRAMIPIVVTQGRSLAQSSTQAQTPTNSSVAAHEVIWEDPRTSVPRGSLNRRRSTPCSLRVPDAIPQPAVKGKEATPTTESLAYTPISARCKFDLFLTTT